MLLLLLVAFGCGSGLEGCADLACRRAWAEQRWAADPEGVLSAVDRLADPLDRDAVLIGLIEADPGRRPDVCAHMWSPAGRSRCERLTLRPHLQAEPPTSHSSRRPAGGPSGPDDLPAVDVPVPGGTELVVDPGCTDPRTAHECAVAAATGFARRQRPARAAAACRTIAEEQWRRECHFWAAEVLARGGGVAVYPKAVGLCGQAGPYRANCLAHVARLVVRAAPPATSSRPGEWGSLARQVAELRSFWDALDPDYALIAEQKAWSEAMADSYGQASEVTGDPLDHLPATAVPHVRAAAAWRLVELTPDPTRSLDGWVDALAAALGGRAKGEEATLRSQGRGGLDDLWPSDEGDEGERADVIYLGVSRRTVAADDGADLAICLLEAAARRDPPWEARLREGLQHPDEAVRWTAGRLLERRTDARRPAAPPTP